VDEMLFETIGIPVFLLAGFCSVSMILVMDWRIRLALLSGVYLAVFLLVSDSWPVAMAVSKLVAGWMAAAVLGMALIGQPGQVTLTSRIQKQTTGKWFPLRVDPARYFHLLAALIIAIFTFSISPAIQAWIPGIKNAQLWTGLLLLGMGLLQTGFRTDVFSTILGLLTLLSGFEIIYAEIERSTLVAGLLATVTLGLSLVGAYLLLSPEIEGNE
jgi:hypothetical protein